MRIIEAGLMMTAGSADIPENRMAKGRLARLLWTALGTLFLGIGIVGIPVPILPTTPFLLLATGCYLRGSARMHRWMMTNRYFGRQLRDYSEGRGVSRRTKAAALVALWGLIGLSALFATENLAIRLVLMAVAAGVTIHIITLESKRGDSRTSEDRQKAE